MVLNVVDYGKSLFPSVSRTFHWWVELLIEMELEVRNAFIRKLITIQGCRCIMRDMSLCSCGDTMIRNVVDCCRLR
jgi:hypothetical protein